MNSVIRKELREHRLVLLGALVSVLIVATMDVDTRGVRTDFLEEEFFGTVLVIAAATAFVMAISQSVKELPRDQWAFLIHRGVSPSRIFAGKAIAGLLLYGVVSVAPVAYMLVRFAMAGVETKAFDWAQFRMSWSAIAVGPSLYFAVLLVVWRQASLFKTRLLPLVLPVIAYAAVLGFGYQLDGSRIPVWSFGLLALTAAILAIAAWGAFIRNGESLDRPAAATGSLGFALFSVILTISVFSYCMVFVFMNEVLEFRPQYQMDWYSFRINEDGQVLRTRHGRVANQMEAQPGARTWRVVNLDTSEELTLNEVDLSDNTTDFEAKLRLVQTVWIAPRNLVFRFLMDDRNHVMRYIQDVPVESTPKQNVELTWVYSSTDRLFRGYRVTRDNVTRQETVEWTQTLGPDGFTERNVEGKTFAKLLAADNRSWFGTRLSWTSDSDRRHIPTPAGPLRESNERGFLFEDGIYLVDFRRQSMRRFFTGREGQPIRAIRPFGRRVPSHFGSESSTSEAVCVLYDDGVLDVHEAVPVFEKEVSSGKENVPQHMRHRVAELQPEDIQTSEMYRMLPGKRLRSITIPESIQSCPLVEIAELGAAEQPADERRIAYTARGFFSGIAQQRVVIATREGEVISDRTISRLPAGVPWIIQLTTASAALVTPLLAIPVVLLLDVGLELFFGSGTATGEFLWIMLTDHPASTLMMLLSFVAVGLLCAGVASRTARKYDFTASERRRWMIWSLLLGPAGLLTLYSLRQWAPKIKCEVCQSNKQLATHTKCSDCGSDLSPADHDGTEIFAGQEIDSPAEVAEMAVATE